MAKITDLSFACLLALCGTSCAHAAAETTERTLTIVGMGTLEVRPDRASIRAGVETMGDAPNDALEANSVLMERVYMALSALRIPEHNIGTSQISVQNVVERDEHGNFTNKIIGYRASNSVSIRVDDLSLVSRILPALTEAGATNIQGVSFEIRELETHRNEARRLAIRNAVAQAEDMASTAGASLGPILQMEPGNNARRVVVGAPAVGVPITSIGEEAYSYAVPIAPEEQTVTEYVTITYGIE